jgi:hypothetical protein
MSGFSYEIPLPWDILLAVTIEYFKGNATGFVQCRPPEMPTIG